MICTRCKLDKPDESFSKDKLSKSGLYIYCKECQSLRAKKWYRSNKKRQLDLARDQYKITYEDFLLMFVLCAVWPISPVVAFVMFLHEHLCEKFKTKHHEFLGSFYAKEHEDGLAHIARLDEAMAEDFLFGINMRYVDINHKKEIRAALRKRLSWFKAQRDFEKYFLDGK